MSGLFRSEALAAREVPFLGSAVLRPPLSFAAWSAIAALLAGALVSFLFFGEYTRRTRVVGITAPEAGLIKLLAPAPGIVVERRVQEGQPVTAGEVLFVLSAERLSDGGSGVAGTQSAILEQLQRRRESLAGAQARQQLLTETQAAAARRRLAELESEAVQVERELATQSARVASAEAQVRRFEELARQDFMSELAVQQKREDLLDQTSRLLALDRMRLALRRDAGAVADELRQIPLRGEQQLAELRRALAALEQDIAGTEANRRIAVAAPQDGTVTAILADVGQTAGGQPLATLLPPYQKFGQHDGQVAEVSKTALAAGELPAQVAQLAQQSAGDGLYRITVTLQSPTISAYGRPQPLTAGMQLEADVMQDRRRLIEWVFEPLVSLRGKV